MQWVTRGSGEQSWLGRKASGQAQSPRAWPLRVLVFTLQVSSQTLVFPTPAKAGASDFSKGKLKTTHTPLCIFTVISEKKK